MPDDGLRSPDHIQGEAEHFHRSGTPATRFLTNHVHILEPLVAHDLIRERQRRGIDGRDDVRDGVYYVMPFPTNAQQELIGGLAAILQKVVGEREGGRVQAGANVSDRRDGWEQNFRVPDIVVVLKQGRAVDCTTHWCGGPDFLVEIHGPDDDPEKTIPFYSSIQVQELLIVQRDSRQVSLYRHDGTALVRHDPGMFRGRSWWACSGLLPLCFRQKIGTDRNLLEVGRMDKRKVWRL